MKLLRQNFEKYHFMKSCREQVEIVININAGRTVDTYPCVVLTPGVKREVDISATDCGMSFEGRMILPLRIVLCYMANMGLCVSLMIYWSHILFLFLHDFSFTFLWGVDKVFLSFSLKVRIYMPENMFKAGTAKMDSHHRCKQRDCFFF